MTLEEGAERMTTSVDAVVVCDDGVHCGDCPHLKPYGYENDLTARCALTGNDLMWHDYWIASECADTHNDLSERR